MVQARVNGEVLQNAGFPFSCLEIDPKTGTLKTDIWKTDKHGKKLPILILEPKGIWVCKTPCENIFFRVAQNLWFPSKPHPLIKAAGRLVGGREHSGAAVRAHDAEHLRGAHLRDLATLGRSCLVESVEKLIWGSAF